MQDNDPTTADASPCFEWFCILKASRQALQPGKLLLAAAGLILTFLLGTALDRIWTSMEWGIDTPTLQASPLIAQAGSADSETTHGVFAVLLEHEKHCLDQALKAARKLRLTAGMGDVWSRLDLAGEAQSKPTVGDGYGMIAFGLAMGKGVYWVVTHHWVYSTIFGFLMLTIWSLFGGAVCRISALQFSADQRPSMGEALSYAKGKFGAFFAAPMVPILLMLLIGLSMLIGGWMMRIPVIGPVAGSLIFGLALLGGGVLALLLIGTLGGVSLMWPTVAVEGLDFTDAISRSLSYFYERMERAILFALLAIVYGAVVWLVVRSFAFVLVFATHSFVGSGYPELDNMWDRPSYDQLYALPGDSAEIEGWTARNIAFPLIRTWISLGGFLLYGYLISYYFTGSTIIYLLLRKRVDETDLDDIYIESAGVGQPPPVEPASQDTAG